MYRVAIVDDHPVARHGLTAMLDPVPDVQVVAAIADVAALPRDEHGAIAIDIALLDLYLNDDLPALSTISSLSKQVPVLVISASRDPADVLAAMQAGASGYLTKHADADACLAAIRGVADSGFHLSAQLADLLQAATQTGRAVHREDLSPRERETLSYIARGFTHQQTATRMGVSKSTVDTYIVRIRNKLNLGNKAELALAALRYLVTPTGAPTVPSQRPSPVMRSDDTAAPAERDAAG
jgi:DNA-binding NarL/FixJ family response regulator